MSKKEPTDIMVTRKLQFRKRNGSPRGFSYTYEELKAMISEDGKRVVYKHEFPDDSKIVARVNEHFKQGKSIESLPVDWHNTYVRVYKMYKKGAIARDIFINKTVDYKPLTSAHREFYKGLSKEVLLLFRLANDRLRYMTYKNKEKILRRIRKTEAMFGCEFTDTECIAIRSVYKAYVDRKRKNKNEFRKFDINIDLVKNFPKVGKLKNYDKIISILTQNQIKDNNDDDK